MKISYNWLKEYLRSDLGVDELARILTDTGLEVDSLEKIESVNLDGVVVGQVLTCEDHPDSDHLHVTTVDIGGDVLPIVCGATNVAKGQKVLVATVGTVLPGDFKIKKSKIRGVESHGMICAEDELGIGTSHEGIMVLGDSFIPGTTAVEALGLQGDYCIEIGLTPNRVDGASHIGVARDVAAYLLTHNGDVRVVMPDVSPFKVDDHSLPMPVSVCDEGAIRYAGVTISGLKNGASPEWMQGYLRAIGLNPHNVLVDITNFVLHELGQPLHAFDAALIEGGIFVRTCEEGTKFTTLDGMERVLHADDLMICDARGPLCIAGVMGGMDSGVSDGTTNIFLESACFDPVRVRKTAKRHGINSDASFLFERGVDPNMAVYALKRAAMLYKELAGGIVSSDIVDVYPNPVSSHRFEFSLSKANRLIGKDLPRRTVLGILTALDVVVEEDKGDVLRVAVPAYRVDVTREVDLVEEVLRIYGYNNVELPVSLRSSLSSTPRPDKDKLQWAVSELFTSNGFTEIMSNSLTRAGYYEGSQSLVKILNPLSQDLNAMRQTLLWGALEAVARNTNHRNADLKLYEFGNCYFHDPAKEGLSAYKEVSRLGVLITGLDVQSSWNSASKPTDFFTLSGTIERMLRRFGFSLEKMPFVIAENPLYDRAVTYSLNGKEFLTIGVVGGGVLKAMDLKAPVYWAEMDFGALLKAFSKLRIKAHELPKFPSVRRDLALLVDKDVTFRRLRDIAFGVEKKLLTSVELFDVYEGDKTPVGKKSYALRFTLQDREATLTDRTIDAVMNNILTQFEKQVYATIRQ